MTASISRYRLLVPPALIVLSFAISTASFAKDKDSDRRTQIPICDKKIGALAIHETEDTWWLRYNLESPEALLQLAK